MSTDQRPRPRPAPDDSDSEHIECRCTAILNMWGQRHTHTRADCADARAARGERR